MREKSCRSSRVSAEVCWAVKQGEEHTEQPLAQSLMGADLC